MSDEDKEKEKPAEFKPIVKVGTTVIMSNKEDEGDEDEESSKFKTIVAKQAVHVLRLSGNDINKFVSKVQKGENITDEESEKAQTDTVASFYMSELLSDDLKNKKRNDSNDSKNK